MKHYISNDEQHQKDLERISMLRYIDDEFMTICFDGFIEGADFSVLPETYIIFITENDIIGDNEPIYPIERTILVSGKLFDDEEHIIYVNGAYNDDSTKLGKLMHDFFCANPDDMNYEVLANKAKYYKESEEGVKNMSQILEDMRNEVAAVKELETKRNIARELLKNGKNTIEDIAKCTGLSLDDVIELKGTITA